MISKNKLSFLIFSLFFIVNVTSSGGHFDAHDGMEYFLATESMILKHSAQVYPDSPSIKKLAVNITKTINDQYLLQNRTPPKAPLKPTYIAHCCLLSAIAVPFYYAANLLSLSPTTVVPLFVNPMILALISVVIFRFSFEIYRSKKIAFILSLIFGVGSFAWPYVTTLNPDPLAALLVITSAFFIYISVMQVKTNNGKNSICEDTVKKRILFAGLSGLFLGFSLFAHPTNAFVIPGFIAYAFFMSKRNKKILISFLILLSIVIFFAGLVNYWRFGSVTDFGYGFQQSLLTNRGFPAGEGLLGLLISPGFGLIFFLPISVFVPIALVYMYKEDKPLSLLFAYIILIIWLYYGTHSITTAGNDISASWNGNQWGPRFLIVILPPLILIFGALIKHLQRTQVILKFLIIALCITGFCVNLLGILVWYMYGFAYGWEREELWRLDVLHQSTPIATSWDAMTWIPRYSPVLLDMKVLTSDFLAKMPGYLADKELTPISIYMGLAPCSYDLYIYCKAGVGPTLLLSAVIVILATVIIMNRPKMLIFYLKDVAKTWYRYCSEYINRGRY